jgi:hypothetical protein
MSSRRISVQLSADCPMQRITPSMHLFERDDVTNLIYFENISKKRNIRKTYGDLQSKQPNSMSH